MRRALLLLAFALLLSACGGRAAGPADGPAELGFTAPTLDGGQLDGASLEGRDVVLWFWAPW